MNKKALLLTVLLVAGVCNLQAAPHKHEALSKQSVVASSSALSFTADAKPATTAALASPVQVAFDLGSVPKLDFSKSVRMEGGMGLPGFFAAIPQSTPEPSSYLLGLIALAVLGFEIRRRRAASL